jgi:hypothetical protein
MQRDLLKVETILRLTPKVTPAVRPEPPPLLPDMAPMQTATRVEVPAAAMAVAAGVGGSADSGSPTPSPATSPAGMQSVQNWLVADGSRPSTRPGRIRRWSLVHPRAKFAVAGTLLAIGLLSVFIALTFRGGGSSSTQAAAGVPADAGTAEPSVKVALAGSADAGRRAAADADAGRAEVAASPEAPAARLPEAGVAAAADAAPPAGPKVTISLDGMPDGAEVWIDGVKVVDGMAVVAQSEEKPVTITARAPGYLDYETEYLPVADTIFFVEMEPEEAAAADGGREGRDAGDAGADARREATTTVRRDGGTTTVRRDGGTTTVRRDAGTTRRDGGFGIIGHYE